MTTPPWCREKVMVYIIIIIFGLYIAQIIYNFILKFISLCFHFLGYNYVFLVNYVAVIKEDACQTVGGASA